MVQIIYINVIYVLLNIENYSEVKKNKSLKQLYNFLLNFGFLIIYHKILLLFIYLFIF